MLILQMITGEKGLRVDLPGSPGLRGEFGSPGDLGTNFISQFLL